MVNVNELMFSVEVTTYNQKEYIAQTLQSIIDQQHNYKYEILVSDDCSSDGTKDVIQQFYEKYPDIIKPVYNEKNLGAMNNYYATISRAKGKYIMECAGDDYWLPGKVEAQIDFMEKNSGFDLCYGKAELLDASTNQIISEVGKNYIDFKDIIPNGNECPALTLCIRRDFFQKYLDEIKPQNKNWLMEDYPFLIYSAYNTKIYFINQKLAVYRVVQNSISHQTNIDKQLKYEQSVYDVKTFFAEKYNVTIPVFDINEKRMEIIREKSVFYKFLSILKKIIKAIIPYGIIILARKIKK